MKLSKKGLTTCLLLCLSFSALAQYNQLRRGQPSIFGESIEVEISEYRRIREKIFTYDTLFLRWNIARVRYEELAREMENKDSIQINERIRYSDTIAGKDKTIIGLRSEFDKLAGVSRKMIIFKDPILDTSTKVFGSLVLGVIIGVLIAK